MSNMPRHLLKTDKSITDNIVLLYVDTPPMIWDSEELGEGIIGMESNRLKSSATISITTTQLVVHR